MKKASISDSLTSMSKALDITSDAARVELDLLKDLAILSDTTVRRSEFDWKNLKPNWKPEKKPYFSRWLTSLLFQPEPTDKIH